MKALIVINYASEEDIGKKTSIHLLNEENEWVSDMRRNRMNKTSELLKEFEELCKYVREVHCDDTVCGYCEYDCGTVGEEPMECPGFETDECFKLKEEFKKRYMGETE